VQPLLRGGLHEEQLHVEQLQARELGEHLARRDRLPLDHVNLRESARDLRGDGGPRAGGQVDDAVELEDVVDRQQRRGFRAQAHRGLGLRAEPQHLADEKRRQLVAALGDHAVARKHGAVPEEHPAARRPLDDDVLPPVFDRPLRRRLLHEHVPFEAVVDDRPGRYDDHLPHPLVHDPGLAVHARHEPRLRAGRVGDLRPDRAQVRCAVEHQPLRFDGRGERLVRIGGERQLHRLADAHAVDVPLEDVDPDPHVRAVDDLEEMLVRCDDRADGDVAVHDRAVHRAHHVDGPENRAVVPLEEALDRLRADAQAAELGLRDGHGGPRLLGRGPRVRQLAHGRDLRRREPAEAGERLLRERPLRPRGEQLELDGLELQAGDGRQPLAAPDGLARLGEHRRDAAADARGHEGVAVPRGHEPRVGERPLVERAEFDVGDLDLQGPRGGGAHHERAPFAIHLHALARQRRVPFVAARRRRADNGGDRHRRQQRPSRDAGPGPTSS